MKHSIADYLADIMRWPTISQERILLGGLLFEPRSKHLVPYVNPSAFLDKRHRVLAWYVKNSADMKVIPHLTEHAVQQYQATTAAQILYLDALANVIEKDGKMRLCGGREYIERLFTCYRDHRNTAPALRTAEEYVVLRSVDGVLRIVNANAVPKTKPPVGATYRGFNEASKES